MGCLFLFILLITITLLFLGVIQQTNGMRVKLACVNWVSHLEAIVTQDLGERPLDVIAEEIKLLGLNCVRLTWPIFLVTNNLVIGLGLRYKMSPIQNP
ncbi:hypothetical protein CR513_54722, partial [Mucuna pruriens]